MVVMNALEYDKTYVRLTHGLRLQRCRIDRFYGDCAFSPPAFALLVGVIYLT